VGFDQIHTPVPHKSYLFLHHFYPPMVHAHSEQYHTTTTTTTAATATTITTITTAVLIVLYVEPPYKIKCIKLYHEVGQKIAILREIWLLRCWLLQKHVILTC